MNTVQFVEPYYAYIITILNFWGFVSQLKLVTYTPLSTHLLADGMSYVPKIP